MAVAMGDKPADKEISFLAGDVEYALRFYESRHQYWAKGGHWKAWTNVPAATSIARLTDPPGEALLTWAARLSAEACAARLAQPEASSVDAIAAGIRAPVEAREKAGEWGTLIHAIFEKLAEGGACNPASDEAKAAQNAMTDWWNEWEVRPILSEFMALNPLMGYAGTGDLLAEATDPATKERGIWYLDLKTGSGVYPSAFAQIGGYAMAHEAMGRAPWDHAAILHLPRGATKVSVRRQTKDQADREAFMAARVLHAWGRR